MPSRSPISIRSSLQTERHDPVQAVDRDGKVRIADRLGDGSGQPRPADLSLQEPKTRDQDRDQQAKHGAEPAKHPYRSTHQKACPRLI